MSLDLAHIPEGRGRRVLVAMSGGVDSSAAAAMLLERGYEVVGCFMRLGSPGETLDQPLPFDSAGVVCDPDKIKIGHQGCCSVGDAADAREVAAVLGISLYVCNFKKDFGWIIDYFVDEYVSGRTPNPCVRCNDWLKFGKLHDYAEQVGASMVASGHYARTGMVDRAVSLMRGVDTAKDQSYVLFGAPRARLDRMLLPVGWFHKSEVRAYAESKGLPVFDKPDSQEICFVPDQDYAGLVERRRPDAINPGEVLDEDGNTVGEHQGQHRFTIGQRRGIGVALGYPIYVVEKDPEANTVTVGTRERLRVTDLEVHEANWLVEPPEGDTAVLACHRSHGELMQAKIRVAQNVAAGPSGRTGSFKLVYDHPAEGVAPGQAVVLYDPAKPERVLGGGWIASAK